MLKVFIAEDEPLIRDSLRFLVTSLEEELSITYAGEAGDGEIALSMIQEIKPDILLTDIKMPFMDGLTLAKYAKEIIPWLKVIVISGFDDFKYTQKAIAIGVQGYLSKPINQEELITVIQKVKEKLLDEKQLASNHQQQEQLLNHEYFKNHLINELENQVLSPEQLFSLEKKINFRAIGQTYSCVLANIEMKTLSRQQYLKLVLRFNELFDLDEHVLSAVTATGNICCLVSGPDDKTLRDKCFHVADILKYELERYRYPYLIGIGSLANRISELAIVLKLTKKSLLVLATNEKNRIVEIDNFFKEDTNDELLSLASWAHNVSELDAEAIEEMSTHLLLQATQNSHGKEQATLNLLLQLLHYIKSMDPEVYQQLHQEYSHEELVQLANMPTLVKLTLRVFLEKIIQISQKKQHATISKHESVIYKAKDYIQKKFPDPNLSLQSVADYVGISSTYLSTLFTQIVGDNFIEFVTDIRINAAKQLLESTEKKITDITFDVGYNDPNYFSYLFKRKVGLSPKAYRTRCHSLT